MKQLIPALLAALCLLLASCGTSPAATLPMGTEDPPVESAAPESTGPWAPTGEQMQKENAVTDLLNESGEGYSYRIPQLNCQTQDAELINTAISDELMPLVDEAHTAQAQGYDPTCGRATGAATCSCSSPTRPTRTTAPIIRSTASTASPARV